MPNYKRKYRKWKKRARGRYSRKGRRTFSSRVKRVLLKKAETKYYDFAQENTNLYHNTGTLGGAFVKAVIWDPWAVIQTGPGRMNRIGDTISPTGIRFNIWLSNKDTRTNVIYRIVCAIMPRSYASAAVTNGSIDPAPVLQNGSLGNYLILPFDKEKGIKVLYDKCFSICGKWQTNSAGAAKESSRRMSLYIKRKRSKPIRYQPGGQVVNNIFAMYIIPYDAYGTLTADNIGSVAVFGRMYWKDL